MSFGPSNTTKAATNNLGGLGNYAQNNLMPMYQAAGGKELAAGTNTLDSGLNLFRTLLNGNTANTTAALAPQINDTRAANANAIKAISTLTPRGGGREGALFSQALAPTSSLINLFNTVRPQAASTVANAGMQRAGLGLNLFGLGNDALRSAAGVQNNLAGIGFQEQQNRNNAFGALGRGIFSLATTPFGGGTAANGLLGLV